MRRRALNDELRMGELLVQVIRDRPNAGDIPEVRMRQHPDLGVELLVRRGELHQVGLLIAKKAEQ